ncbi:hypothetical protein C2E23DRAFT_733382 [Lenzites betulinus]|nr:hypothetical protein C2E23DRAFT_733382 [Lenzites betulinus]
MLPFLNLQDHDRSESRRSHSPRTPQTYPWDDYYMMGNPSSVFIGPNGEITTSGDPETMGGTVPNNPVPANAQPATDSASQASESAVPSTKVVKDEQTSSTMQTSTTVTTSTSVASTSSISTSSSGTSIATSTSQVSTGSASSLGLPTTSTASPPTSSAPQESSTLTTASSSSIVVAPSSSHSDEPSAGASPTSRVNSASSTDTSDRSTTFYVGIAFATIAGIGLVVAILAWWLRIRSRTRRCKLNRTTTWPWDSDRFGGRQMSLEGGLGIHGYEGSMIQRSALSSPDFGRGGHGAYPTFPAPPAPVHTQGSSPYVTVSLHNAHQSVPDLAPDLGNLQITNLAPGDLSGGESGRSNTALGMLHTYPTEYGTPFMPRRPCFLGVEDGGLDVPWGPLRVRRPGSVRTTGRVPPPAAHTADIMTFSAYSEKFDTPLPYPGDISVSADTARPPASDNRQGSWAASIRSNLVNAFNAVVGASPSQIPIVHANDGFTRAPHRRHPIPHDSLESDAGPATLMTREESVEPPAQDPFADNATVQIPLPAPVMGQYAYSGGLLGVSSQDESLTRASSVYSTITVDAPMVSRVEDVPPQLPSIPSLSGADNADPSMTAEGGVNPQDPFADNSGTQYRKQTRTRKYRRPTLLARHSSSQASTSSAGSDMSRTSSSASEHLTDGERFAKNALRERRRRVMEMSASGINVSRGKTRRMRATLSRKR